MDAANITKKNRKEFKIGEVQMQGYFHYLNQIHQLLKEDQ